jgi:hypothetical protein
LLLAPNCTEARNSTIVDGRVRGQRIEDRYGYRYSLVELRCGGAACTRALCICRISFGGSCGGTVVRTFRVLRETRSFCAGPIDSVATSIARSGVVLNDEPSSNCSVAGRCPSRLAAHASNCINRFSDVAASTLARAGSATVDTRFSLSIRSDFAIEDSPEEDSPESEGDWDARVSCGMLGATIVAVRLVSNFAAFSTEKSTTPKTITAATKKSLAKTLRRDLRGL